jgi:ParB/Sulfiredoxin domain
MAVVRKAKVTVWETTDYEVFDSSNNNRRVDRVDELMKSMEKHGFIPAYTLHVRQLGTKKYRVIGGHNRLEAARRLGIPVLFTVCSDTATIHELERSNKKWSLNDFLHSFTQQGMSDYNYLRRFHNNSKIPVQECIHLLQSKKGLYGRQRADVFKDGDLYIENPNFGLRVSDMVTHLTGLGIRFARHTNFIRALRFLMVLNDFNGDQLKHKVKTFPDLLTKQSNTESYIDNIEYVHNYNMKAELKKPLAYLARQKILERRRESADLAQKTFQKSRKKNLTEQPTFH